MVYLHQDFTVTRSMGHGEDRLLAEPSEEWSRFCEDELGFPIQTAQPSRTARIAAMVPTAATRPAAT